MPENNENHWKIMKKVTFLSCVQEAHVRPMNENEEKSYPKWATSFWVTTGFWESLPIANQQAFFLNFSSWASVSMMKTVLFSWFLNVFHCFRPCEHMCLLVEIHNNVKMKKLFVCCKKYINQHLNPPTIWIWLIIFRYTSYNFWPVITNFDAFLKNLQCKHAKNTVFNLI